MSEPTSEASENTSAATESETMDHKKAFASIIREMIRNENDITNQRLTWMTTLNGLMLTGSSLLWKTYDSFMIYMICFVGIAINFSSFLSLNYSQRARSRLLKIWKKKLKMWKKSREGIIFPSKQHIIPPVIGYPPTNTVIKWCLPWILLPWTFIAFWIFLVGFRLAKCE